MLSLYPVLHAEWKKKKEHTLCFSRTLSHLNCGNNRASLEATKWFCFPFLLRPAQIKHDEFKAATEGILWEERRSSFSFYISLKCKVLHPFPPVNGRTVINQEGKIRTEINFKANPHCCCLPIVTCSRAAKPLAERCARPLCKSQRPTPRTRWQTDAIHSSRRRKYVLMTCRLYV